MSRNCSLMEITSKHPEIMILPAGLKHLPDQTLKDNVQIVSKIDRVEVNEYKPLSQKEI